MKFTLLFASLLVSQLSMAQSIREKKIKKDMLERTDTLIEKVELAREDLENEDVASACKKIKEIFVLYPQHLTAIGSHLDFDRNREIKAKDDALSQLVSVHKESQLCDQGKENEYVDASEMRKELKKTLKSLKKQRRIIRKSETGNENRFYYEYEF